MPKVKWYDVCFKKSQGGLGIRSLSGWNIALLSKHMWNVLSNKESLWVRWVNSYRLNGKNFWAVKVDVGPLIDYLTPRDVHIAGMSLNAQIVQKIGDLLVYPNHVLRDEERDRVWDDIRASRDEDILERWDVPRGDVCCLCNQVQESHDHLLIGCSYAKSVWRWFRGKAGLDGIIDRIEYGTSQWNDVVNIMAGTICNKGIWSIIRRLVFAAVIYHLWQERNARIFENDSSSHDVIAKRVFEVVRLRLMGLQVKKSMQSHSAAKVWKFSFGDGGPTHLSV
ncbi:uncharacterized protein [Rutidosis leptorrhynchoides]|uniref:uncharacterized protein n=1 Tax=Rutidosis leptorrhynchoides TaxID=125765 RepID=UPI003A9A5BD8